MDGLDRQVAAIAVYQHSLITLADVVAAGGTRSDAWGRVTSGRWESPFESVYRITGVPWTYEARVLSLILAAGDGARASHRCAARLQRLGFATAPPEISIPRGRHHRPAQFIVHTSTDLDRCEVVVRDGIPCTDPARTVLDLGRYLRERALTKAVESARRQELVTWHDLISCLTAHARKGRHGVKRLRSVIGVGMANDEITDTDSELMALGLLREYGFPEPTLQHKVRDENGEVAAEMDFAYLDKKVNFEINGTVHLLPEVQAKDDARDHWLRGRGWTVRRIWYEIPIRQPEKFVEIVRNTLRSAN